MVVIVTFPHVPCRVVHDDAMRIMKYSLEEMLSKDAADRALEFWSTVVEPFFGLPPRQKELSAKVLKVVTLTSVYCPSPSPEQ